MRRGSQGGVGGGGTGASSGFSKPPPAPHGGPGRARLHTPDINGSVSKDRYG